MATTFNPADLLISEAQLLPLAEVLNLPPDRLMGVTPDALAALNALGVSTVFDLAMSGVFNAAVQIDDAADNQANAMNRFGRPVTDLLKPGIGGAVAVPDLRNQSIDILADIDDAAAVQAALGVTTVRDLSVYPPFRAANEILTRAFFPEQLEAFDAESPADLVPKSGEFPTERVQYNVLVLDELLRPENAPPLIDLAGPDFQPIDVAPVADPNFGFSTLGLGMLLTLNQSWFMQGVTLGHLLHSMALAAGESTRIAVIDWSRKVSAGQTELIGETEDLSQDTNRNRTISEVTEAVAKEAQTGFSHTESESVTKQAGAAGGGIIGGVFGFGASASIAKTSTSADSYATSAGSREVGASMLQQANDRTHQHAHAARTRRASVVREVSQSEHENVSTRVITNYNHMHALTVQYYEVLQAYRTETSVTRCDRVVFVPFKLLDFTNTDLLRRFRGALIDAALTPAIRDTLLNFDTLEFVPERRVSFPGLGGTLTDILAAPRADLAPTIRIGTVARSAAPTSPADGGVSTPPPEPPTLPPQPPRPPSPGGDLADTLWENAAAKLSAFFGSPTLRRGSESLFVPSDVHVEEGAVQSTVRSLNVVFVLRDGTRIADLTKSQPLADVDRIAISGSDPTTDVPATVVLALSRNGIVFPLELPTVTVPKGAQETKVVDIRAAGANVNLVQHLADNRLHYSQAVFRQLDAAMIAGLLSPFSITMNGNVFPLLQVAEPNPLRIVGNALAFKINTDPVHDAEWRAFMRKRGIVIGQSKVDIVPLSSGGIFAEAVLGRFNCAERLDLSRFFNWQDSPIPIAPPDIAAVGTGSRQAAEDLTPGQLSAPLVQISPPANLPDPSGLAGTLATLQSANLFRDMSGLADTIKLATETAKLSAAGATSAGSQAVDAFKVAADLEKAKSLKDKSLTEKGAVVNKEEALKKQQAEAAKKSGGSAGSNGGSSSGSGGSSPGSGGSGGSSGGTSSGSSTPAPTTTGNSALDHIIGNPDALRSFIGLPADSPDPTPAVTSEGVPVQAWDVAGAGALFVQDNESTTPELATSAEIIEIIDKGAWKPTGLSDLRTTLLGDRQLFANALDRVLLPLSLAPAGSVKTLNIVAHATSTLQISFLQDFVFNRADGILSPFSDDESPRPKLATVDLNELLALLATPEIASGTTAVKLSDVRKAFPADGELHVFNLSNPLREDFIQALANVLQVRTTGLSSKPVRVTPTVIGQTDDGDPILSKKIDVGFVGDPVANPVDFFANLLQQDKGALGLFTAFPRRG